VVELFDDDPDIVARMLIYLYNPLYYASFADWEYNGEYDRGAFPEARRRQALLIPNDKACVNKTFLDPLAVNAKLHGLSHKYDIPELTKLSSERFSELVAHIVVLDPHMTTYPEFLEDLILTIKITYGSEQMSDHTLRDATVYLAREFVRSTLSTSCDGPYFDMMQAKENLDAFQEVLISISDFAWDMISINFDRADFVCDYCQSEFVIQKGGPDQTKCVCSRRGLCGECASVSQLACRCIDCGEKGGCHSIKTRNILMTEACGVRADEVEQNQD
jgi:hypothetical protein